MSLLTLESKFARFRASCICDFNRVSSRLCSSNTSRCLARLFCLVADAVREASESRSRDSCDIRASRYTMSATGL